MSDWRYAWPYPMTAPRADLRAMPPRIEVPASGGCGSRGWVSCWVRRPPPGTHPRQHRGSGRRVRRGVHLAMETTMTTDDLRRLVCPTGSAKPVDNMTANPGGRTPGNLAAAGDAGSPGDVNSPDVTRAGRDVTGDDVLERIRQLGATDDSFDDRLIGWLADRAPEIVWAVLDDMAELAATHGVER